MKVEKKPNHSQDLLTEKSTPENSQNSFSPKTCQPKQIQPEPAKIAPQKKVKVVLIRLLIFFVILHLVIEVLKGFFNVISCGANRAMNSEPKQYISSINKGQQAYFVENTKFSNSIQELGLGLKTQTRNFKYSTRATENTAFSYAIPRPDAEDAYETVSFGLFSWPKRREFKGYVGAVYLVPTNYTNSQLSNNDLTTQSLLCVSTSPNPTQIADPTLQHGVPTCGNGTVEVTR